MSVLSLVVACACLALGGTWLAGLASWPLLRRLPGRHVGLALILSLAVGLALAIATLVPTHASGCHCGLDAPSVVHLCVSHPERAMPLLPVALPLLALLLARPALAALRLARAVRTGRALAASGRPHEHEPDVLLTDLPLRNAFAFGERVVVDREWWEGLAAWERDVVLEHERTHLRRRDGLALALFALASSLLPGTLASTLLQRWKLRAEQEADAAAARRLGDPLAVADLLVRQHRAIDVRGEAWPALSHECGLEQRVEALLDEHGALAQARRRPLVPVAVLLATLPAAWLAAPLVHEIAESLAAWMAR